MRLFFSLMLVTSMLGFTPYHAAAADSSALSKEISSEVTTGEEFRNFEEITETLKELSPDQKVKLLELSEKYPDAKFKVVRNENASKLPLSEFEKIFPTTEKGSYTYNPVGGGEQGFIGLLCFAGGTVTLTICLILIASTPAH